MTNYWDTRPIAPRPNEWDPTPGWYANFSTPYGDFYNYLSAKYRQSFIAPEEAGSMTGSQAASLINNLQSGNEATLIGINKQQQMELEFWYWSSLGYPPIWPTGTAPSGEIDMAKWNSMVGVGPEAYLPGQTGFATTNIAPSLAPVETSYYNIETILEKAPAGFLEAGYSSVEKETLVQSQPPATGITGNNKLLGLGLLGVGGYYLLKRRA